LYTSKYQQQASRGEIDRRREGYQGETLPPADRPTTTHVHHNRAIWITGAGAGNILNDNVAALFNIWLGNIDVNNLIANVCP
jgi:hypothetical protein